jgi:Ca-activated chloride channel family protein
MTNRHSLLRFATLCVATCGLIWSGSRLISTTAEAASPGQAVPRTGGLLIVDKHGNTPAPCPLQRTEVKAEISGFLNRVTVTQLFENPLQETIEAVYTFPLPQNSAVDDMTMLLGDRTVKGLIKPREEARAIYEAARNAGRTAGLLEQERANIFTQSVTNIKPGEKVRITISYVETLKYEAGNYEFVFPMVVGPRYIPGHPAGKQGGGWAQDTNRVPDASRITPPVTPPATRAGHDITVEVAIDAGVPIDRLTSGSHEVDVVRPDARRALVKLRNQATIPNKDFVLRYDVAGAKIEDAVLTHRSDKDGYFTLILQPPDRVAPAEVTPKELVFVLDTSGSMYGFPMDKSKEVMRMALASLNPQDTFNIITFSGDTHILFPEPVPATAENIQRAQTFVEGRRGGGGTEMMKAIRAALDPSDSQKHIRVVAFLTDGYVGNDMEIVAEIQKHSNARVFSFGIGNSVNRFLLDKMAEHGRGEVEYVMLSDDGSAAAKRFYERLRNPLLTDIQVDFSGLPVADIYPKRVPDLFSAKPVVIHGRYTGPGKATVRISGRMAGRPYQRNISVDLPARETRHDVLASLWARTKIEDLMAQDYAGAQSGTIKDELKHQIIRLGLDFRLMTQFTAFVAVELKVVNEGGKVRRIEVPVEMPEGVSYEGVFGERKDMAMQAAPALMGWKHYRGMAGGNIGARSAATAEARPVAPPPTHRPKEYASRDETVKPSPATQKAQLHPDVADLVKGSRTNTSLMKNGKAELKLYLASKEPAILQSLKELGFEVLEQDPLAMTLTGRIAVDKIAELAKLGGIRYIAPR